MLRLIEERIRSSQIAVQHRDVLIRLREMIEDDLATARHCQSAALRTRTKRSHSGCGSDFAEIEADDLTTDQLAREVVP